MSNQTIWTAIESYQDADMQPIGFSRGINAEVAIVVGRFLEDNFYRHGSRSGHPNPSSIHIFEGRAVFEVSLDWLKELSGGTVIETMEDGRLISPHIEEGPIKLIAIAYNAQPNYTEVEVTL